MGMAMEVSSEEGYLWVRLKGDFSLIEIKELFVQMLEAIALNKAKKVLVDCRDLTGAMTTTERYDYSEFGAQELTRRYSQGMPLVRLAYISKPPFYDKTKFGENVAVNRGAQAFTTNNIEKALQWLDIAPSGNT